MKDIHINIFKGIQLQEKVGNAVVGNTRTQGTVETIRIDELTELWNLEKEKEKMANNLQCYRYQRIRAFSVLVPPPAFLTFRNNNNDGDYNTNTELLLKLSSNRLPYMI